jgi:membrane-bound metal-dependent hydrolase YbcI (DUF457 family)
MLGKDHINISIAFILPFLIPLLFLNVGDTLIIVVFMISILIGSLLPDTDCGGKATIYYRFPEIDNFMRKIVGKSTIFMFKHLISKKKITIEYDVKDEHRGIMHSPIGVLLGSLMLVIPIILFGFIFNLLNWIVILTIFFGLLIGQLLHLIEDSCTLSGINWGFPFKKKELKGSIATFNKKDQRPKIFAGMFYFLVFLLVIGYSFDILKNINLFLVYILILIYNIISLFLIGIISKIKIEK